MSINLSDDAVHALNRAAAAAAREGAEAVGPRHILAGALSQRAPALMAALARLDLDLDALPEPLRNAPATYEGHLPFTASGHEALTAAIEASAAAGRDATASTHLVAGVASAGDDDSDAALQEWGLKRDVFAAALSAQPGNESRPGPAAATAVAAMLLALSSCAPDAPPPGPPGGEDPFAATPADGPPPEIGPAPADYRPTAASAPSTDIWVGRLDRGPDGALSVHGLVNATDRDGYDNQPAFDRTGAAIYYTSGVDSTQTDVFRYSLADGAVEQVTRTQGASEFSPTPIPGQDAISAIREERGRQFLWRYGADGSDLGPIFATVEPVGYHAWADERTAAMFVLGDPATLHVGDALSGEAAVAAERPGRSLHRIPGSARVSFVRKPPETRDPGAQAPDTNPPGSQWRIERLDPATGSAELIVETLPGREDHAWTPSGEILMADGAALFAWAADAGWTEVALAGGGEPADAAGDAAEAAAPAAGDISRIAVSPDGSRIALVRDR